MSLAPEGVRDKALPTLDPDREQRPGSRVSGSSVRQDKLSVGEPVLTWGNGMDRVRTPMPGSRVDSNPEVEPWRDRDPFNHAQSGVEE